MADHFPDFQKKVDYISLDSVCLNKRVFYHPKDGIARNNGYDPADWAIRISDVMDVPAADVRPVVRGHWIEHISDLFPADSTIECDQCHAEQPTGIDDNFCPNCGADMREANLDTTKGERRDESSG